MKENEIMTEAEKHLNKIIQSWEASDVLQRILIGEYVAMKTGNLKEYFDGKSVVEYIREAFWTGYALVTEMELKKLNRMKSLMNNCVDCEVNLADYPSKRCPGCDAYREHQQ